MGDSMSFGEHRFDQFIRDGPECLRFRPVRLDGNDGRAAVTGHADAQFKRDFTQKGNAKPLGFGPCAAVAEGVVDGPEDDTEFRFVNEQGKWKIDISHEDKDIFSRLFLVAESDRYLPINP